MKPVLLFTMVSELFILRVEVFAERVVLFIEAADLFTKQAEVFYDLRVSNKGNFSNGITTIQGKYAPEFSSHSEGIRISVD